MDSTNLTTNKIESIKVQADKVSEDLSQLLAMIKFLISSLGTVQTEVTAAEAFMAGVEAEKETIATKLAELAKVQAEVSIIEAGKAALEEERTIIAQDRAVLREQKVRLDAREEKLTAKANQLQQMLND